MTGQLLGCDPIEGVLAVFSELSGAEMVVTMQVSTASV